MTRTQALRMAKANKARKQRPAAERLARSVGGKVLANGSVLMQFWRDPRPWPRRLEVGEWVHADTGEPL